MKRLIALFICFSSFVQLFSPILVLADESVPAPVPESVVIVPVEQSTPVSPSSEPTVAPIAESPNDFPSLEKSSSERVESVGSPSPAATVPQPENTTPPATVIPPSPAATPVVSQTPSPSFLPTIRPEGSSLSLPLTSPEPDTLSSTPFPASESALLAPSSSDAEASPSASFMKTGDALAMADVTSVSNVSLRDSCLKIQTVQLQGSENGDFSDVTCSQIPSAASEATPTAQLGETTIQPTSSTQPGNGPVTASASARQNSSSDSTHIMVTADTGGNKIESTGDTTIVTGDALALAQLQQLLNLSLVDSNLWLLFVSLLPSFTGDIILPTPEMMARQFSGTNSQIGQPDLDNEAQLQNNLASTANSGLNETSGSSTALATGDAFAAANIFTLANSEVSDALWYILWLNVAGQWGGYVYGWESGSSVLQYDPYQTAILAGFGQPSPPPTGDNCGAGPCGADEIQNEAIVHNTVSAVANTGNNEIQASGSAVLQTGKAISLVNLVALLNARINNSRLFLGFLNILGDWQGSVHLARPELQVTLHSDRSAVTVGEQVAYTIAYRNQGYDRASAVSLAFQVPSGTHYLSSSLEPTEKSSTGVVVWDLDQLAKGQEGAITVLLQVDEWSALHARAKLSPKWWEQLVPVAQAAEDSRHFTVSTAIATVDEQSSTQANQASLTTTVYPLSTSNSDEQNPYKINENDVLPSGDYEFALLPSEALDSAALHWPIELQVSNNVNNFIYPGDTVQFWVNVRNLGDAPLRNATITHQLQDEQGQLLMVVFPLGNLPAHKEGRLSFGLTVPGMSLSGPLVLHSQTIFHGQLDTGQWVYSDKQETSFIVQPKLLNFHWQPPTGPIVSTAQADDGQVLGVSTSKSNTPADQPPASWILFLSLLLAFLSVRTLRYRLNQQYQRREW